jgi:hypothetical protein
MHLSRPEYIAHHVARDVGRGQFLAQLLQRPTIIVGDGNDVTHRPTHPWARKPFPRRERPKGGAGARLPYRRPASRDEAMAKGAAPFVACRSRAELREGGSTLAN